MDNKQLAAFTATLSHPKAQKFVVLDVEGYSTTRPYNVGYLIADKYGTIYLKRSIALPACIWENIVSMIPSRQAEEMTKANIEEILKDIEKKQNRRKYQQMSVKQFKKLFISDLKMFHVKHLYAYNVSFDKGSLQRLFGAEDFQKIGLEYRDIISGVVQTKLINKKYIDFCNTHNFITDKGNIKTKAEIVYKFLFNSLDFIEEHTGLADCEIEYQILLTVFKTHKKINWKPCQAWKILKKYCQDRNIEVKTPGLDEGGR